MTGLRRPATLARPSPTLAESTTPSRRRGQLVAVAVVALLVTGLGWWISQQQSSGQGTARPAPTPSATRSTAAQANSPRAGSGSVVWQDFAGLDLPVSDVAGPLCRSAGRAWCFADTDDGAALAAVNLLVRTFPFAGSAVFGPTIRNQVLGPDAAALARLTAEAYEPLAAAADIRNGAPIRSEGGWIAGYRIDPPTATGGDGIIRGLPTGKTLVVRVLVRQSGSDGAASFTLYTVHLVRRDGDWALVAPAWGDWRSSAQAMSTADPPLYAGYDAIGRP